MLQRTRADQVLPVYVHFISKWKDPKTLGSAGIGEIFTVFAKLGLSW
jgi:adenine-specific DNA glycosylase